MAERVLVDSLISSTSANRLTDAGERLFLRIVAAPTTDNWGRRKAALSVLRGDCIPLLDWSDEKLAAALAELVREDMVVVYTVAGCDYLAVTNWDRHQRKLLGLRRNHGRSRIPDPPDDGPAAARGAPPCTVLPHGGPVPLSKSKPSAVIESEDLEPELLTAVQVHAARASSNGDDWRRLDGMRRFRALADTLGGADARTPIALRDAARGLPEAAIHSALESLEKRRRVSPALVSEARYVCAALTNMRHEGTYR